MMPNGVQPKSVDLPIGEHTLRYEPPETVFLVLRGVVNGDEANAIMEQLVDRSRGKPCILLVVDIQRLSLLSMEARKVGASIGHRLPPRVLAVFGGSFAMRALLDLVLRAGELLGSKDRFVKHLPDEQSARAWVEQMRPVLLANAGDGKGER